MLILLPAYTSAQDLTITSKDLIVTQGTDGGFHLYIRKKQGMASVLLTETTKDPRMQADNYAYRAREWNSYNGDERRMLDGDFLPPNNKNGYSLIDSTPEVIRELGQAFHVYIPYIIDYGYEWTRHGEIYVGNGTYFNIRAFTRPYGDYRGTFKDNSFVLTIDQKPLEGRPADLFMKDTVNAFGEISSEGGGELVYSLGPEDIVEKISDLLSQRAGRDLDLVLCIDTTASMKNDLAAVRTQLSAMIREQMNNYQYMRVGFVFYKDYYDEYVTKWYSFTDDLSIIQKTLNGVKAGGGRDIPEAVHEALYDAATKFEWQARNRKIILIGDAPPHPRMRGKISKDMAMNAAMKLNITIDAILLPQ
ncbi:MAG: VWA domain-containing protein [Termitinemataceae bacterium]|nr:MAG: VWA domain-containing protein [Termitinemataceae bacterium]